jgi:CubicO group peptidase (beta-lactamase class C family)
MSKRSHETLGQPSEVRQAITALLEREVVSAGVAPFAAAGFCRLDGQSVREAGYAGGAHERSVFDLASVTKTCVALTTSLLVESGRLSWESRLDELLPWLVGTPGGAQSLEAHLSHRAGLVAHREFFLPQQAGLPVERRAIFERAAREVREGPASTPVYSDLGYLLVGEALEQRFGEPLDQLVRTELTGPRGWAIASSRQWRAFGDEVRGVVHDDNAWAIGGSGLSGHAGLFGTLTGVLDLAHTLLLAARGRGELAHPLRRLLLPRAGGSLRLGLDGISGPGSSAGTLMGPNTFGHLGFTGTSFWCDPDAGIAVCLLTNRVWPSRENVAIRAARPRVHDGLFRLAGGLGPDSTP